MDKVREAMRGGWGTAKGRWHYFRAGKALCKRAKWDGQRGGFLLAHEPRAGKICEVCRQVREGQLAEARAALEEAQNGPK